MIESLESRTLLAATGIGKGNTFNPGEFGRPVVTVGGSKLTLGNAHDLQIIEQERGVIQVNDWSVGGSSADVKFYGTVDNPITQVVIIGTSGGDQLNSGTDYANVTINGGAGADQIIVADNIATNLGGGSTTVFAGDGNDTLIVSRTKFNSGTKVFGELGRDSYSGPRGVFAQ